MLFYVLGKLWDTFWWFIVWGPDDPPKITGLQVGVFVRQPNGSKTSLEHYLERELIERDALVVTANTQACSTLLKCGELDSTQALTVSRVDLIVLGTLYIGPAGVGEDLGDKEDAAYDSDVRIEFSFRVVSPTGDILASGACMEVLEEDEAGYNDTLEQFASDCIEQLDNSNLWKRVTPALPSPAVKQLQ